jgi:hypothetical protein
VSRRSLTINEDYSSPHGIHAYVTDETGRVWEVLVRPIYTPVTAYGETLPCGWEWLIDGSRQHEVGEPVSRDDAWERALQFIVSYEA